MSVADVADEESFITVSQSWHGPSESDASVAGLNQKTRVMIDLKL